MNSRLVVKVILFSSLLLFHNVFSEVRDSIGDINNDGVINVQDIIRIVNIILQNDPPPTEYEQWAGDVNNDDNIDVTDIIIIVNYILGTGILCDEGYSFCPGSVSECCADVTSHEFIWTVDTLGQYGSLLLDVAVVNENDVWVVGNIETEEGEYNAAKWNGVEWTYYEIINTADLYSITYFSDSDIWVTKFSYPVHWDGENWTQYNLTELGINGGGWASWGTSSSNIYFVGYLGAIVHYNGSEFEQQESTTEILLRDIHGTQDGEWLFATGYEETGESIALVYHEDTWSEIYSGDSYLIEPTSIYGRISSVEVHADTAYFTTTAGLLKYKFPEGEYYLAAENQPSFYDYHFVDISMNTPADIMLFSRVFSFLHFNGESWQHDENVSELQSTWAKGGMLKGDMCVSVGYCCGGQFAYIARGYRQ